MECAWLRDSIDVLLQEAYDGPANPSSTWFVNNARDSGMLGTIRHLTVEQAWHRPDGLGHSVAEHVQHILFSLNLISRLAHGETDVDRDWEHSWDCGPPDEGRWLTMQRQLQESHLRLRMWVHADETFQSKQSLTMLVGAIAHGAYHLGALRQVAALAVQREPATDPRDAMSRPL